MVFRECDLDEHVRLLVVRQYFSSWHALVDTQAHATRIAHTVDRLVPVCGIEPTSEVTRFPDNWRISEEGL